MEPTQLLGKSQSMCTRRIGARPRPHLLPTRTASRPFTEARCSGRSAGVVVDRLAAGRRGRGAGCDGGRLPGFDRVESPGAYLRRAVINTADRGIAMSVASGTVRRFSPATLRCSSRAMLSCSTRSVDCLIASGW